MTSLEERLNKLERRMEAKDSKGWRRYVEHGVLDAVDSEAAFRDRYYKGLLTHREIKNWLSKQPWRKAHRAAMGQLARYEMRVLESGQTGLGNHFGALVLSMITAVTPLEKEVSPSLIAEMRHRLTAPDLEQCKDNELSKTNWRVGWFTAHVAVIQGGGLAATGLRKDLAKGHYPLSDNERPHRFDIYWEIPFTYYPEPFEKCHPTENSRPGPDGERITLGTSDELLTRYTPEEQALWPP